MPEYNSKQYRTVWAQRFAPRDRRPKFGGTNSKIKNGLFNDIEPVRHQQRERPVDRRCAHLAAAGFNVKEIAETVGRTPVTVSNILRQPFVREATLNAIKEDAAADQIKRMLESAAPAAIQRIVSLGESKAGTELGFKADQAIVERFMGKPVQPVSQVKPLESMSDAELEESIIREERARAEGPSHPLSNGAPPKTEYE